MNLSSPFRLNSTAFSAPPKFAFSNGGIFGCKLMAVLTMTFPRLIFSGFSTSDVLFMRNMRWINASMNPAKVIDFKTFRNSSYEQFINDSMGFFVKRPLMNFAIFSSLNRAYPQPAAGLPIDSNFGLKAIRKIAKTEVTHNSPHGIGNDTVGAIFLER